MEPLVFSCAAIPVAKGRPRATIVGGHPRLYTPEATRKYERAIARIAQTAMVGRRLFTGPLCVSVRLRLQPPKSMSKRQRARILAGEEAYLGNMDVDNGAKAVIDALNGVVWADDRQIVRLFSTKVAAAEPGVDIRIEALDWEPDEEAI